MEELLKVSEKILKQVGIALNTAKLYPPGHPMFEKMVEDSLKLLVEFPPGFSTISFYFLENTVIVEKEKLDVSKIPAVQALIKYFNRISIKSFSIDLDAQKKDWESFYKLLSIPIKELKEAGDPGVLLHQLGAERIRVNDVEFGIISTKQKVEIKFDIESVIESIKRGEKISREEAFEFFRELTGIPPDDLQKFPREKIIEEIKKFQKNVYSRFGFIEPEKLSSLLAEIFEILSPDLRTEILKDMTDIEELKKIANEIIKSLPEEELLKLILSSGSDKKAEIIKILPDEKKEKIKIAILKEEKVFPGGGFGGEGIISVEIEEKISKLYKMLKTETEEKKIKEEIANFLNDLIGSDYNQNPEKVPEVVESLKIIATFLLERYGIDAFEDFSLLGSHILSLLTPEIKTNVYEYLSRTKEMAEIIRGILPSLSDEELISLFSSRVKNFPEETDEIVNTLPKDKRIILKEKELVEGGEGKPFIPSRKLLEIEKLARETHLVITGEKRFEAMKKELEEGIRTSEVEEMIAPFLKGIDSEDPSQRKYSVNGIGTLLISFLKAGKIKLAKALLKYFEKNIKEEEDLEVFFAYLEYLEKGYVLAKEKNLQDFIEFFELEFKNLLDIKEKRKFVLKSLGKTRTEFALRMLLTTLWEEESIEEIREALLPLGKRAGKELLKLFPEIENLVVRRRILELLASLPEWETEDLKELLFDKRWSVQRDVIYLIGEKRIKEMIPHIKELALKGQDIVRREAIRALSKIKGEEAEEILIMALEDKNEEIKKEALKALCSDLSEKNYPVIQRYFKEYIQNFNETLLPFIMEMLRGLKKFKNKEILPLLFKIVEDKKLFGKPAYPSPLRKEAVKLLAEYKENKEVVKRMENFLNDPDPEIRAFIRIFISKHGKQ